MNTTLGHVLLHFVEKTEFLSTLMFSQVSSAALAS